MIHFDDVATMS